MAVGCFEAFKVLGDVLGEAFAFGWDVDLAFVDNGDVEAGAGAGKEEWLVSGSRLKAISCMDNSTKETDRKGYRCNRTYQGKTR